jgi:hypothetical protein
VVRDYIITSNLPQVTVDPLIVDDVGGEIFWIATNQEMTVEGFTNRLLGENRVNLIGAVNE